MRKQLKNKTGLIILITILIIGMSGFQGTSNPIPFKINEIETSIFVFAFDNGTKVFADMNNVSTIFANEANNTIRAFGIKANSDTMAIHFNGGNGEYLYAPSFVNGTAQDIGTPFFGFWSHYYFNVTGNGWSDFILSETWFQNNGVNPTNKITVFNQSGTLGFYYNVTGTVQTSDVAFSNGLKINTSKAEPSFAMISSFQVDDTPASYTINNVGFGYELTQADFNFPDEYKFKKLSIGSFNGTFEFHANGSIVDGENQVIYNITELPYRPNDRYQGIFNNLTFITPSTEYFNFEFSDIMDAGFNNKYFEIHREDFSATQQNNITILIGAYNLTDYSNNDVINVDPKVSQSSLSTIPTFDFGDSPEIQSSFSAITPPETTTTTDILPPPNGSEPDPIPYTETGIPLSIVFLPFALGILVYNKKK